MPDGRSAVATLRIVCDSCPRSCRLSPRETGVCGALRSVDGQLVPARRGPTFRLRVGESTSPFARFLPSEPFLRVQSRGSGLCLAGGETDGDDANDTAWDLGTPQCTPDEAAFLARAWGCRAVFLETDDPVFGTRQGHEILDRAAAASLRRAVRTTGYVTAKMRESLFAGVDAVELVLWGLSPALYRRHFAVRPDPVFETAAWLRARGDVWIEVLVPLLPGENDYKSELERTSRWIRETLGARTPVRFVAGTARVGEPSLLAATSTAREAGLVDVDAIRPGVRRSAPPVEIPDAAAEC